MSSLPVIGYTNRLSARPGDEVTVHVSAPCGRFDARLVRLSSDPLAAEHIPSAFDGSYEATDRPIVTGSYMRVEAGVPVPREPDISVWVCATLPADGDPQGILCWGPAHGIFLSADGHVEARWGHELAVSARSLREQGWYALSLRIDAGQLLLSVSSDGRHERAVGRTSCAQPTGSAAAAFRIATIAAGDTHIGYFNGKIARPCVRDGLSLVAEWNLGDNPQVRLVTDKGPHARHGMLFNRPQKGMTGPGWAGDTAGWTEAPAQYDAVAFHSDDLSDAGWPAACALEIPADLSSGAYGIELQVPGGRDVLPIFVTPTPARRSRLAFIVPTFSYLAYANERHWWSSPAIKQITGKTLEEIVGPLERWGAATGLLSPYDYHRDRTGNAHASLLRPLVNVRPDYIHPLLRGPHQLSADILTLEWLRKNDFEFDVVTDHCLHEEGLSALAGYRVVMTGSHPEYVSREIMDAVESYIAQGGRVVHLGGNAFYFVTATFADEPHVLEVRRGYAGTISWQSAPGEIRLAANGEPGGLWRWRGRSAHRLFGTGMAGYGFGSSRPYMRTPVSYSDACSWIFAGVSGDRIDAPGVLMGGAAGFEFDAMRADLGTPEDTICLAVAKDFDSLAFLATEDQLSTGPLAPLESHMTLLERPGGGKVFSAPSVAWTAALGAFGGDNDVARVTANVLRRFLS